MNELRSSDIASRALGSQRIGSCLRNAKKRLTFCGAVFLALCIGWLSPAQAAPAVEPSKKQDPLLLTYFFYWYCNETGEHFVDPDGSDAMTTHPIESKRYCYRNADWWAEQLTEVKKAGIQGILPVYWGTPCKADSWSKTGLKFLVKGWNKLQEQEKTPPKAGMFYDTSTLKWNSRREHIDIGTAEGEEFFCRTICEFFNMVPRSMWLRREGKPVVFLYSAHFAKGKNPRLFESVRESFRGEFDTGLYLVKEVSWPQKADATYAWGGALGLKLHDVASLGPGYDHSAVPGRRPLVVPREKGAFYKQNWEKLLSLAPSRRPEVVCVETWNEFHEGTDIAPSVEYGRKYVKLTAHYARLFRRGVQLALKGKWQGSRSVAWKGGSDGGISIPSKGDGLVVRKRLKGKRCVETTSNKFGPNRYVYVDLHDSFAYDPLGKSFRVTVNLLVKERSAVFVDYDSCDRSSSPGSGAFKRAPKLGPFEPGVWHTVSFVIRDPRFINRTNGADVRFSCGDTDFAIARVHVEKIDRSPGKGR